MFPVKPPLQGNHRFFSVTNRAGFPTLPNKHITISNHTLKEYNFLTILIGTIPSTKKNLDTHLHE